jgi:hypothetical protein
MEVKSHVSKDNKFKFFFRNRPPIPILLICIFEIIGLLLLPSAFGSEESVNLGLLYQIYLVLTGVLSIAIIYSLWKVMKIGILIYIGAYVIHNIVALIVGNWMIGVLIIPFIGLILIGLSRKKFK